MNNKGFAITTILYGIMVLFCLLLVSLLGILSSYRKTQELLINESNGARDILNIENNNSLNDDGGETGDNGGNDNGEVTHNSPKLIFVCRIGNFIGNVPVVSEGQVIELSKIKYSCDFLGKTFKGWNTDPQSTIALSSIKIENEDVTLYDIWNNNGNSSMD